MSNQVIYKGTALAKNSDAYDLFDKREYAKLDYHLQGVELKYTKSIGGTWPAHLVNYKIGQHPEDWK